MGYEVFLVCLFFSCWYKRWDKGKSTIKLTWKDSSNKNFEQVDFLDKDVEWDGAISFFLYDVHRILRDKYSD